MANEGWYGLYGYCEIGYFLKSKMCSAADGR